MLPRTDLIHDISKRLWKIRGFLIAAREHNDQIQSFLEQETVQRTFQAFLIKWQKCISTPEMQAEYDAAFSALIKEKIDDNQPEKKEHQPDELNDENLIAFFTKHPEIFDDFNNLLPDLEKINQNFNQYNLDQSEALLVEGRVVFKLNSYKNETNQQAIQNVIDVIKGNTADLSSAGRAFLKTPQALLAFAHIANKTMVYFNKVPQVIRDEIKNDLAPYKEFYITYLRNTEISQNSATTEQGKRARNKVILCRKILQIIDELLYAGKTKQFITLEELKFLNTFPNLRNSIPETIYFLLKKNALRGAISTDDRTTSFFNNPFIRRGLWGLAIGLGIIAFAGLVIGITFATGGGAAILGIPLIGTALAGSAATLPAAIGISAAAVAVSGLGFLGGVIAEGVKTIVNAIYQWANSETKNKKIDATIKAPPVLQQKTSARTVLKPDRTVSDPLNEAINAPVEPPPTLQKTSASVVLKTIDRPPSNPLNETYVKFDALIDKTPEPIKSNLKTIRIFINQLQCTDIADELTEFLKGILILVLEVIGASNENRNKSIKKLFDKFTALSSQINEEDSTILANYLGQFIREINACALPIKTANPINTQLNIPNELTILNQYNRSLMGQDLSHLRPQDIIYIKETPDSCYVYVIDELCEGIKHHRCLLDRNDQRFSQPNQERLLENPKIAFKLAEECADTKKAHEEIRQGISTRRAC